jgi:hypothetical protein
VLPFAFFIPDVIRRLNDIIAEDPFTFVINRQDFHVSMIDALLFSPNVITALSVGHTSRRFEVSDSNIDHTLIEPLFRIHLGDRVRISGSSRKSLILLSSHLRNTRFERLFFDLRFEKRTIQVDFHSIIPRESRPIEMTYDLCSYSTAEFWLVDIDTLGSIMSNESL